MNHISRMVRGCLTRSHPSNTCREPGDAGATRTQWHQV